LHYLGEAIGEAGRSEVLVLEYGACQWLARAAAGGMEAGLLSRVLEWSVGVWGGLACSVAGLRGRERLQLEIWLKNLHRLFYYSPKGIGQDDTVAKWRGVDQVREKVLERLG
jgi:hypothetical protein